MPPSPAAPLPRTPATPPEAFRRASEAEMQWWRDAKFGMFIHWGPAAIGGGDISWCRLGPERRGDHQFVAEPRIPADVYDNLYRRFHPKRFDAREWVGIAQAAGMRYMVLTAKHHDGFCLWDTRLGGHRVTAPDCPCGVDVVRELADACHAAGMRLGLYYSARDWYHPDYLTAEHARYLAYYHGQLLELLCDYSRIDVLWFDHIGGEHALWDPDLVLRTARMLQPGILINNRLHASVHHGSLPEYRGDFDTPEQRVGAFRLDRDWESCLCLVGGVWSYKPGGEMMTFEQCLRGLLHCAGGGGNLLLNTGPMPDGRIEPRQADRLREVGDWLRQYGDTVYGTRGGPFRPGTWGVSTHRDRTIYLHLLQWDGDAVRLPPIGRRVVRSTVPTGGTADVRQDAEGLTVEMPEPARHAQDTIVVLELDGPVDPQAPAFARALAGESEPHG